MKTKINMENFIIYRISINLQQEGNTLGTTQEIEEMEIILEAPLGSMDKDGAFLVIKTDGWSLQNGQELKALLKRIESLNIGDLLRE